MDLEGNIVRFNDEEQQALQYRYPAEMEAGLIDLDAMQHGIEEREAALSGRRRDGDVGRLTEDAFRLAADKRIVGEIVETLRTHGMGVSLEAAPEGTPND